MLEHELNELDQQIRESFVKEEKANLRLNRAIELYQTLGPGGVAENPTTIFNLKAFKADPEQTPWEERMTVLRRTILVRQNLAKAILKIAETCTEIPLQRQMLESQRAELLPKIHTSLNTDFNFILASVRSGDLAASELEWIKSQFKKYNFDYPQNVETPTTKLAEFFSAAKNNELLRTFTRSDSMDKLITCLQLEFDEPTVSPDKLRGCVAGFIFESIVSSNVRSILAPKFHRPFLVIDPNTVFEIYKQVNPDREVTDFVHGLNRGIAGISLPDILVGVFRKDELEFVGFGEFSVANPLRQTFESKERQLRYFNEKDNMSYQNLQTFIEQYNQNIGEPNILDNYPKLKNKKLSLRPQDKGFGVAYFYPDNLMPPNGYSKDLLFPVNLSSVSLGSFIDAIYSDITTEWTLLKQVNVDSIKKAADRVTKSA